MRRVNDALKRPRAGGGLPDKRRAIIAGAMTLFARDGYTRASLDAIAAESGVSSRTIYNHFKDKAQLFEAVIQDSSQRTADAQLAVIDRHLGKIVDLESDLVEFGLAWRAVSGGGADAAPHFALVRQILAEHEHIPPPAIEAWMRNGPRRVREELAARLSRIAQREALDVPDPERAAAHLILLISGDNLSTRAEAPDEKEITATVAAAVHTFLYGYRRPGP